MKKIKRLVAGVLALNLVFSIKVFADIPDGTVVIGNKAYDLSYLNNKDNVDEIRNMISLNNGQEIYVKATNGKWYANSTLDEVSSENIKEVLYKAADGTFKAYEAQDGEEVSAEDMIFKVDRIAFTSLSNLEIVFTQKVSDKNLKESLKINGEALSGDDVVKLSEDGKKVGIKLKTPLNEKNDKIAIGLDRNISADDGQVLAKVVEKKMMVISSDNYVFEEKQIDGDIIVLSDKLELKDIEVKGDLIISKEKANIVVSGNTKVNNTFVADEVSLNQKDGATFGKILIKDINDIKKEVELKGNYKDDIVVMTSCKLKTEKGKTISNVIIHTLNQDAKVALDGKFDNVTIDGKIGELKLEKGCEIKVLKSEELNKVSGDSSNKIGEIISENKEMQDVSFAPAPIPYTSDSVPSNYYKEKKYTSGIMTLKVRCKRANDSFANAKMIIEMSEGVVDGDKAAITLYNSKGEIILWEEAYFEGNATEIALKYYKKGSYRIKIKPNNQIEAITLDYVIE